MKQGKNLLNDDLLKLLPLTPAVFFILFALRDGQKHGYAIMQQVNVLSDGRFRMGPGTLYTTIQRLLELGLIEEIAGIGEAAARRRYYRLTRVGTALFEAEVNRMESVVRLIHQKRLAPRRTD